jgi:hypothetical protein
VNTTVVYTFILLFLMLGAGLLSGTTGFSLGSDALKGITQPDSRPNKNANNAKPSSGVKDEIKLLREEEIIKTMKERIDSSAKGSAKSIPEKDKEKDAKKDEKSADAAKFPQTVQDREVALEVTGSRRDGDSVLLDVALKNDSAQAVQFRYSFLTITDDQGRILNGDAVGLPAELPAKSDKYSGVIKIASGALGKAEKVSVQLSDYPEQKIQLRLNNIAVKSGQ